MNFHTDVKDTIDPEMFKRRAKRAAHKVAASAEKDINNFVPRRTGVLRENVQLDGRKVHWPGPYAGVLYHGELMVDKDTNLGGYPFPNYGPDFFRSRRGAKKINSKKPLHFQIGAPKWIGEAKKAYAARWMAIARKELLKDH